MALVFNSSPLPQLASDNFWNGCFGVVRGRVSLVKSGVHGCVPRGWLFLRHSLVVGRIQGKIESATSGKTAINAAKSGLTSSPEPLWGTVPTLPITPAGSDGRCNTPHCIDSTMFPSGNYLFGSVQSKPSQGGVPADLTTPRAFSFCFQFREGLCLVLRRPIETTPFTRALACQRTTFDRADCSMRRRHTPLFVYLLARHLPSWVHTAIAVPLRLPLVPTMGDPLPHSARSPSRPSALSR
jgi:hypothetical protein